MTSCIINLLWLLQSAAPPGEEGGPGPAQTFTFDDDERVEGTRDAPLIDWMCGVTRAKHESLIETRPLHGFGPDLKEVVSDE